MMKGTDITIMNLFISNKQQGISIYKAKIPLQILGIMEKHNGSDVLIHCYYYMAVKVN